MADDETRRDEPSLWDLLEEFEVLKKQQQRMDARHNHPLYESLVELRQEVNGMRDQVTAIERRVTWIFWLVSILVLGTVLHELARWLGW